MDVIACNKGEDAIGATLDAMTAKNEDKVSSNDIICFAFSHIDLPQVTHLGAKIHFFFEMCKNCVKKREFL